MIDEKQEELVSPSTDQEIVIEPVKLEEEVVPVENQENPVESANEVVEEPAPREVENAPEEAPKEEPKYEEIVTVLRQYFNALRDSIRLAKTKDETIAKMKNELVKYREDFGYSLLKQLINSLISFREDAKNTLRNVEKFSSDVDTTKKYLGYLDDDFVEMLSTFSIEYDGEKFLLDGKDLNSIPMRKVDNYVPKEEKESEEVKEEAKEEKPATSLQDVLDLVYKNKENIEAILKDNALLDENFKEVEAIAASVDKNYADALLLPSYKKVTNFYLKLKKKIDHALETLSDENKTMLYSDVLIFVLSQSSELLSHFGVEIDVDISDNYDMKTNRMLKFIPTDKAELDKKIAFRHTDTYLYNGKVIYLCKVDVYKYEQK